ncbi:G -activated inward rectifier potassium channel 3-like [Brachionus plicatilis]|uniref:G-activated inward rectifier potassium channel 3-like n=1 Tax=Brachionus plicatilis TaxID=10195 RepID=A0A3M7PX78_BRAPC|nr:G -activated inward rectifier potassium channel 3-like [Brachionus plicatilis]
MYIIMRQLRKIGHLIAFYRTYLHGDLDTSAETDQPWHKNKTHELVKVSYLKNAMELIDQVSDSIQTNEKIPTLNQTLGDILRKQASKIRQRQPCVNGIHDFTSALLYSVETQHTIGYGLRYITEECKFAIIFLMLQSCFGIFVQGLVAGVVFAKISRPNKRKRTIIFSHNAVISERDNKLCFMFKIGNIRTSQLSDARLRVSMIKSRKTKEAEFIPFQSYDMKVGFDWSGDNVFFPWPKTVEHIIDEHSPFYHICREYLAEPRSDNLSNLSQELSSEDYEIVVILEGNIETTGASCHIRTSYLPQEILFGYRFVPVYPKFTDFEYLFDYSKFNQIEPVNYDLINLNRSYFNKESRVYDARKEQKNYQLTLQNSNQTGEKTAKQPASLMAVLSSFKTNSADENTVSTVVDEVETEVGKEESKNGRFTVVPVKESKAKGCSEKSKTGSKHSRTSSLPPIKSSPLINQLALITFFEIDEKPFDLSLQTLIY